MAEVAAPVKPAAKKQEVPVRRITPKQYTFRLLKKYPNYGEGGSSNAFIPRNTDYAERWTPTNQDIIYWPYIDGKPVHFDYEIKPDDVVYYEQRAIRYVVGAKSIFVDEQEANTEIYKLDANGRNRLLENSTNKEHLSFTKGENNVNASNRTLWNFLWCLNRCKNQNPKARDERGNRAKAINAEFELLDFAYMAEQKVNLGIQKEKAFDLARTARVEEMMPHAKYLNIPFTYSGTTDERDIEDIRSDYKDMAYNKPDLFLKTFSDPKIKIVYQISNLLEQNEITLLKTPGQAHWVNTGAFIAVIPPEVKPIDFLADFAMTKDGEEFMKLLRAFKN